MPDHSERKLATVLFAVERHSRQTWFLLPGAAVRLDGAALG